MYVTRSYISNFNYLSGDQASAEFDYYAAASTNTKIKYRIFM